MMADEAEQHWRELASDARKQAHANAEHCANLLDGVLKGCDAILLATEVIEYPGARLAFVDELFTAIRRTVSVGETMEQLEATVRKLWEKRRG